jgi:hypothetical protein
MTQFQYLNEGNTEAQDKLAEAYLFAQSSEGIATTGVLSGLAVSQTTTASANVVVGAGAGIVQASRLNGADRLINDTDYTLDVLTSNPVGGLPRNDIVVFDSATVAAGTGGIRVVVGTPNAIPTDPTVPSTAIPSARLRHAASATTVPAAKIDDLRTFTKLAEASVGTDTGWLDLPIVPGGWTVPSGQVRWQARRRGGLVHFRGALQNAAYASLATICTLPTGIPAPPAVTSALALASNTTATRAVWVQQDGTVQAYASGASNAWYIISGSYPID